MACTPEPRPARLTAVFGGGLVLLAGLYLAARTLGASDGAVAVVLSALLGVAAALFTGSLGEWAVHRYVMHRPLRRGLLALPFELHHVAHHRVQFPPDEYVQRDRVQRVPVRGRRAGRVCASAFGRAMVVASHVAFYAGFALVLAVAPGFLLAGNTAFAWALTATTALFLFLFVHVHDAVHHPGLSPLERFAWFRFLDRHHYVHHVDTGANTNFLLPLGDILLGTLRRELTDTERATWPTYAEARSNVVRPTFGPDGVKRRGPAGRRLGAEARRACRR